MWSLAADRSPIHAARAAAPVAIDVDATLVTAAHSQAGLAVLAPEDPSVPRYAVVEAYLREQAGDLARTARLFGDAARTATNLAGRDHPTRQAARLNDALRP